MRCAKLLALQSTALRKLRNQRFSLRPDPPTNPCNCPVFLYSSTSAQREAERKNEHTRRGCKDAQFAEPVRRAKRRPSPSSAANQDFMRKMSFGTCDLGQEGYNHQNSGIGEQASHFKGLTVRTVADAVKQSAAGLRVDPHMLLQALYGMHNPSGQWRFDRRIDAA